MNPYVKVFYHTTRLVLLIVVMCVTIPVLLNAHSTAIATLGFLLLVASILLFIHFVRSAYKQLDEYHNQKG